MYESHSGRARSLARQAKIDDRNSQLFLHSSDVIPLSSVLLGSAAEDAAKVQGAKDGRRHGRWQGPQEGQFVYQ